MICTKNLMKQKKEAATLIKARIKELFTNYIGSFGNWHSELCNEIKNKYSDVNSENTLFTYGNAQKWVNMTIKYICILGLLNDNNDYQDKIKNYMDDFHVPVDSYIIDELWGNPNIKLPSISSNVKREKTYTTPSDYVISWSNWTDKNYGDFREKLDKTYNLQWEGKAWIEQAEKRKKKEKQAKRDSFFKENNPQE